MKALKTFILLLALPTFGCSYWTRQSLEKRLNRHARDIANSNFSLINFNGIYLASFDIKRDTIANSYYYFKFFQNGKVYKSRRFINEAPSEKNVEDYSGGEWLVYYIRENTIYIEEYNHYNGYYLLAGYFNENHTRIFFNQFETLHHHMINKEAYAVTLNTLPF